MAGMPRRVPDFPDAYAGWNLVSSIGSYITAAGMLVFLYVLYSVFVANRVRCPANPWGEGATTLEWTVSSPPPFHTFEDPPYMGAPARAGH